MSTPAGWYEDPFTDDTLRYWNGESWTRDTLPKPPAAPAPVVPPTPVDSAPVGSAQPAKPGGLADGTAGPVSATPGAAPEQRVVDYLVPSILALLFCAWPLAIPALVFALRARSSAKKGDVAEAFRLSKSARLWIIVSGVVGILIWAYLIFIFATTGQNPASGTISGTS